MIGRLICRIFGHTHTCACVVRYEGELYRYKGCGRCGEPFEDHAYRL